MSQSGNSPSAEEARALLARAEGIGTSATSAEAWPAAVGLAAAFRELRA